jgi:hypothetical protein
MPPPMAPRAPRRSGIPRVIGILALVFCGIGLLVNCAMYAGMRGDARTFGVFEELGFYGTWITISFVFGFLVFALHLVAGIAATAYKRSAPALITAYAVLAIASVVGDMLVVTFAFPDALQPYQADLGQSRLGLAVIALPWPIVALVLMNLRGAKRACGVATETTQDRA